MREMWGELEKELGVDYLQWYYLLDAIIFCAVYRNVNQAKTVQGVKKELKNNAREIAECVHKLSGLLQAHLEIAEKKGFNSIGIDDLLELFQEAGEGDLMTVAGKMNYQDYIKPRIDEIVTRFCPVRYYPDTVMILNQLGNHAENYEPTSYFQEDTSRKASPRQFIEALVKRIKQDCHCGLLPLKLRLTHKSMATITRAMLNLDVSKGFGEDNVKRWAKWD
jgi:hypothetical protein